MKKIIPLWSKILILSRRYPIFFGAIAGFLTWVLIQSVSGFIQNSTYEYFKYTVLPWMQFTSQVKNYISVVSLVVAFGIGMFLGNISRSILNKKSDGKFSNATIAEIHTLIGSLRGQKVFPYYDMVAEINKHFQKSFVEKNEINLNTAVDNYFLTIFKYLGRDIVHGGGIMLPDTNSPEWLFFWKMSPDQVASPKRFYIGAEAIHADEKGMASYVFMDGKPEIVNILDPHTGKADNPKFRNFGLNPLGHPRIIIPYRSGICMPVNFNSHVIATISIESNQIDTFDEDSKSLLQPIADQLGIILFHYSIVNVH